MYPMGAQGYPKTPKGDQSGTQGDAKYFQKDTLRARSVPRVFPEVSGVPPLRKKTSKRHWNSLGENSSAIKFAKAGSLQGAFEKMFLQWIWPWISPAAASSMWNRTTDMVHATKKYKRRKNMVIQDSWGSAGNSYILKHSWPQFDSGVIVYSETFCRHAHIIRRIQRSALQPRLTYWMQRSMPYIFASCKHTCCVGILILQKCWHIVPTTHGSILHASEASHISYKMPKSISSG